MKKFINIIYPYIIAGIGSSLILFFVLKLWNADLKAPFVYYYDGLFCLMLIKGMIDNGWFLHNTFIGMPSGLDIHDFPITDNFHLLFVKLISLFFPDPATAMNIYYLLTFPLTTMTSLFVFRYFKFSYATSILGSLLFTFLPYHLFRGEGHIFLSAYYLIPLMVMVILLLFRNGAFVFKYDEERKNKLRLNFRDHKFILVICLCVLIGSAGVYYAFFCCFLLLIAGISGKIFRKKFYPLLASAILVSIISITLLINMAPSILYTYKYGKNIEVAKRSAVDAEIYGMKITQLILPVDGHRVSYLHNLKNRYNHAPYRPLVNENTTSSLGAIGTFGFFILIGWLFYKHPQASNSELKISLSILNASAVFLGTIGGLGAVFALIISPQIRAYNRISVYIAFFSLFAVVIFLEDFFNRHRKSIKKAAFYSLLILLTAIGILDQTTKYMVPAYASVRAEYFSDADFVSKIEASVSKNTMIFQLPYVAFPGSWPVHKMLDYSHFKGYLHSKTLRWSYGAIRGRGDDKWQRMISKLPIDELIETISAAGFRGIYLDRYGFEDMGAELETKLSNLLETRPIISLDKRLVFFEIPEYKYIKKSIQKVQEFKVKKRLIQEDIDDYYSAKVNLNLRAGSIDLFECDRDLQKIQIISVIHAAGWAFDPKIKKPAKFVIILDNGKPLIKVPVNINRKDVALTLNNDGLLMTGWDAIFTAKKIGEGKHRLEFHAVLLDGSFAPLQDHKGNIYFDIEIF